MEAAGIPDVKGVWGLDESSAAMAIVVAIRQRYPGHAMQTALVTAGCRGGGYMSRYIIVVDDDIDITNPHDVIWAIATRSEPSESLDIVRHNWTSRLDPRIPREDKQSGNTTHSKAIILAVRPFHRRNEFPIVNKISDGLKEEIVRRYADLLMETRSQAEQPLRYRAKPREAEEKAAPPVPM
jgi:4-hydroxy-3-polyprenylbenzoate decarboxylase